MQLIGGMAISLVVPIWCLWYEHFLGPISQLLSTQIDRLHIRWWYSNIYKAWWIWTMEGPWYYWCKCMGIIQRCYYWLDDRFEYPLCPSIHIHGQFSVWTGGYWFSRDKGFLMYFYLRGCVLGHFQYLHSSVSSFEGTIRFTLRDYAQYNIFTWLIQ